MSYDSEKECSGVMFVGDPFPFDEEEISPFEEGDWVKAKKDVHEVFGSRRHLIKKGEVLRVNTKRWGFVYKRWYIGLDGIEGLYEAGKFVKIQKPV